MYLIQKFNFIKKDINITYNVKEIIKKNKYKYLNI